MVTLPLGTSLSQSQVESDLRRSCERYPSSMVIFVDHSLSLPFFVMLSWKVYQVSYLEYNISRTKLHNLVDEQTEIPVNDVIIDTRQAVIALAALHMYDE